MSDRKKLVRTAVFLLIFLLCAAYLYILQGNSPTAEAALRRKEKQMLIGPAEIVETLEFEHSRYTNLLIGKSEYGYTFFEWSGTHWDNGVVHYQPKSEGVTLYCTKYSYDYLDTEQEWLPIFAFAESSAAVHAELTVNTAMNGQSAVYHLEADRGSGGYFLFRLRPAELGPQEFWLIQQLITGEYSEYVIDGTASVTVTLYNRGGELIETCQIQ